MKAPPVPGARTVKCTHCGAPITIRAPALALRVACEFCGSLLDAKDEGLAVIKEYGKKGGFTPLIPLGQRGRFRGKTLEVIGFMRKQILVDGTSYSWTEYLLYNPFHGFHWLCEYNGHWTYMKSTRGEPRKLSELQVEYLGKVYDHFQTSQPKVTLVLGEFYWEVEVGDASTVADFICPPHILSREETEDEVVWTIGEYVDPESVWAAFALSGTPKERFGISPVEPSPYTESWEAVKTYFLAFGCLVFITYFVAITWCQDKLVFQRSFQYRKDQTEHSTISEPFEIPGRTSNVEVRVRSPVTNSWIYPSMALINDQGLSALDFGVEVSYYQGSDDGESWSEGSHEETFCLPSVPAGTYRLRVDPQADPNLAQADFDVTLVRDVPRPYFMFLAIIALFVPMLPYRYRAYSFEYRRWEESDHPYSKLAADSEDDD